LRPPLVTETAASIVKWHDNPGPDRQIVAARDGG
jgi:hypothetical protein